MSHGEVVRLAGRIDRIDLGTVGGQAIFNILDYKTGGGMRFSLEACQRGTVLQLPLYALAAGELILNDRNAVPWQAGYWYISGDGFKPPQALQMYELVEGQPVSQRNLGSDPRHPGRDGRRARQGHAAGPVSRLERRSRLHRPLSLQHRLPHQPDPILGEDMAADGPMKQKNKTQKEKPRNTQNTRKEEKKGERNGNCV